MTPPLQLEDAWRQLLALAAPLESELVGIDDAAGRHLARPLIANRTQPFADLSAMDGFAVAGDGPWRIVGKARAGTPFDRALVAGEATRISTGACCPVGTQGIVLVEDGMVESETLTAQTPVPGRWARPQGFDFAKGAQLLETGTRIGPAQLALARSAGHAQVAVFRQPRVAVFECGDELVADPAACGAGALPASNGAMVAAMAAGVGGKVRQIGPLPDDRETLARAFDGCADADVLVTTAGASVGEHDHVQGALADAGATLAFWRVAVRPGKPLLVARRGAQIVLGLPGNPASSYVTAFLFLLPLLRALQGATRPWPRAIPLALAGSLPPGGDRREFLRGRLTDGRAEPLAERDSSALRTLAAADLLIDRAVSAPAAGDGQLVDCYWIGIGGIA